MFTRSKLCASVTLLLLAGCSDDLVVGACPGPPNGWYGYETRPEMTGCEHHDSDPSSGGSPFDIVAWCECAKNSADKSTCPQPGGQNGGKAYTDFTPWCECARRGVPTPLGDPTIPINDVPEVPYSIPRAPSCWKGATTDSVPHADKLDVLFVVNNGATMADKQVILAQSLPGFVARLVNPYCVDTAGKPMTEQPATGAEPCRRGTREFQPVTDLHLGVITSSIGAHGGDLCDGEAGSELNPNDRAELLPAVRPGLPSYQGADFLSFDAAGEHGVSDVASLISDLQTTILAAGDSGCQFQAPLAAMSRFLFDPTPPKAIEVISGETRSVGVNEGLLAQRAAFLRPDSALAVVILSDEDDCSILDRGNAWTVTSRAGLPPATSVCADHPFDRCCRSCAASETKPPFDCSPLSEDSACGAYLQHSTPLAASEDATSLRCFNQQSRFGVDWLGQADGYDSQFALRPWVSVATITGAPWQDLAMADSLVPNHPLQYMRNDPDQWSLVRADAQSRDAPPRDPFMIGSIEPRDAGLRNPVTGTAIISADSQSPRANPINGHEHRSPARSNLQYACTFELPQPRECSPGDPHCACAPGTGGDLDPIVADNSPLCQRPSGGPAESTQYYAAAYPAPRLLKFAASLREQAVAASICPKTLDRTAIDYGYRPALQALIVDLAPALN